MTSPLRSAANDAASRGDERETSDTVVDGASPFVRVAKAQGPAVGGGAHRVPPTVPNAKRIKHWAGIWDAVAKDMGKQSHDYSQWNQDSMYARTPETTTDEEFTLIVYDWFVGQQKRKPLYKYRPLAWTTWIKAQMAERAFGKRCRNKQTVDEAIKAVLDFLTSENDMGNTARALELFQVELEEVREDNKMATQPLVSSGTGGTTKPIASAPAAKSAEWYDDKTRINPFMAKWGKLCEAFKKDPKAYRVQVQGTEHAKDSRFNSWSEVYSAGVALLMSERPTDWPMIDDEMSSFWSTMLQAGYDRTAVKLAMIKRFKTDKLADIDMDMSRQQFQDVIAGIITAPVPTEAQRSAETDQYFADARAKADEPLKAILRKMYADAGITLTAAIFTRASGFEKFEEAAAKTADAEIISWCREDIAKFATPASNEKPADEKSSDAQNNDEKAPSLNEAAKSSATTSEIENKPVVGEISKPADLKPASAFTTVMINGHEVHVTTYAGMDGDEVASSVFALLDGLGKVLKSDRVKSYGTVTDGRDKVLIFKDKGQILPEPKRAEREAPAVTAQASAPARESNRDTSICSLIKVGTSYEGNKPQLQFECDGFADPLRYTKGDMHKILANVRQGNGKPFTAADMVNGKKFGGEWLVDWEKVEKDGKTRWNVVAVRPSTADEEAA